MSKTCCIVVPHSYTAYHYAAGFTHLYTIGFYPLLTAYPLLLEKLWTIPDFNPQTIDYKPQTPISVIIPARNEEENIKSCLDTILNQSYPEHLFEVLVVDDFSSDNTAAIVSAYASQNIKLISLRNFVEAKALNSYKRKLLRLQCNNRPAN